MKVTRSLLLPALALSIAWPRLAAAQTAAAGNVSLKMTIPDGVTKLKGVLAFTVRGLASGWAGNGAFQDLAKRIEAAIVMVSGGDDLNDGSYPGRCKSGEFNNVPDALTKLGMASNHPELANVPIIGLGHSHGGDYWNWFNACHPDRMAMVFVHASGGVNYGAASLKVPVFYTLGTADLVERGSGMPRAGMFVNRAKGAPMTLVIGQGGHDSQFSAEEYQIVTAIIEAIFKMRVPADADAAKGPVRLNDIVEGESTWVGDLYTKEISPYNAFKGNKALTAFLPNEQLAMMWKPNGPGLPASIKLPADKCGWCGTPKDEPAAGPPSIPPTPPSPGASPDAGGGPAPPMGGGTTPVPPSPVPDPGTVTPPSTNPPPGTTTPPAPTMPSKVTGGCSLVADAPCCALCPALLGLALATLVWRRRRTR